jgi:hypothetical protein
MGIVGLGPAASNSSSSRDAGSTRGRSLATAALQFAPVDRAPADERDQIRRRSAGSASICSRPGLEGCGSAPIRP